MKVLVIGSRIPFPLFDGGAIATYNMLKGLSENGVELVYISLNTRKHFIDEKTIKKEFSFLNSVISFEINTTIKAIDAFKNLFSNTSYNIERFYNTAFEDLIVHEIESNKYDVIHFEGLFIAKYVEKIKTICDTPVILRQHNIEYQIWERLADNEANPLKKWYIQLLADRIKKFEKSIVQKFDAIITIASSDEEIMKKWQGIKSISTIPSGMIIKNHPINNSNKTISDSVYHIGSMEWLPNRQAMEWFYTQVWPRVIKVNPNAQFFMAGKNMPLKYKSWESENFHIIGEVKDLAEFVADKQILIVPLLSASGIRIKTIEAMLMGKAVVTTTIGAKGLPLTNLENCMIADIPEEFAAAMLFLFQNPNKRNELALNGKHIITAVYDINTVSKQWTNLYQSLLLN